MHASLLLLMPLLTPIGTPQRPQQSERVPVLSGPRSLRTRSVPSSAPRPPAPSAPSSSGTFDVPLNAGSLSLEDFDVLEIGTSVDGAVGLDDSSVQGAIKNPPGEASNPIGAHTMLTNRKAR